MATIKTNREVTKKYLKMKYELFHGELGVNAAAHQIDNACHRAAKAVVKTLLSGKGKDIDTAFWESYKVVVDPVLRKYSDMGAGDSEPIRHTEHAMMDILEDLGFDTNEIM